MGSSLLCLGLLCFKRCTASAGLSVCPIALNSRRRRAMHAFMPFKCQCRSFQIPMTQFPFEPNNNLTNQRINFEKKRNHAATLNACSGITEAMPIERKEMPTITKMLLYALSFESHYVQIRVCTRVGTCGEKSKAQTLYLFHTWFMNVCLYVYLVYKFTS